ncbi:MAG: zinc-ribbon domain-containing protein [archaeon]
MLSEGSAITGHDRASEEKAAEDSLSRVDRLIEEAAGSKLARDDQEAEKDTLAPQQEEPVEKPWQRFCSHCGKRLIPMSNFCDRCGTPIDAHRSST